MLKNKFKTIILSLIVAQTPPHLHVASLSRPLPLFHRAVRLTSKMSTTTSHYPIHPDSSNGSHDSPSVQQSQQAQHKRVYQACIPCRRRKVKCDLGSVDNPGDPPCVRCRRESKECFFSATRRKRKTDDGRDDSLDGYEFGDDYIIRNGRKMVHGSPPASIRQSSMGAPTSARSAAPYVDNTPVIPGPPLTPGGSIGRPKPLERPKQQSSPDRSQRHENRSSDESNTQLENQEAQATMRQAVFGPHDALDLLYKAATGPTDGYVASIFKLTSANTLRSPGHKRTRTDSSNQMSPIIGDNAYGDGQRLPPIRSNSQNFQANQMRHPDMSRDAVIDPALASEGLNKADRMQDQGYKDAIKAWSRFRFVRAGWFTPTEAIDYID